MTIFAERLISPLVGAWKKNDNVEAIINMLQKSCETSSANIQWLESFLIKIFHAAKSSQDVEKLLSTLQVFKIICTEIVYFVNACSNFSEIEIKKVVYKSDSGGEFIKDNKQKVFG